MITKEKLLYALKDSIDYMDSWALIDLLSRHFTEKEIIQLGYKAEWDRVNNKEEDEEDEDY
jgi:hypothetical protein